MWGDVMLDNKNELPMGLGFGLAMNEKAMNNFSAMGEEEKVDACMDAKEMFLLAIATSIDALAVGVTFAFLKVQIVPAVSFIGCVTFVCSAIGVKIGSIFGSKYRSKAEFCGGVILILIGLKILLNGLGIM